MMLATVTATAVVAAVPALAQETFKPTFPKWPAA